MTESDPTVEKEEVSTVVKDLGEGDVIRVPQYETPLEVSYVSDLNGESNAFIGVEFIEGKTQTQKTLITNQHSGRVYLTAGTADKGEVTHIQVKRATTQKKEKVASDADSTATETDDNESAATDQEELTGADSPVIGKQLDDRTHYAHVRYAARDEPRIIWYDPRDGREKFATGNFDEDLDAVGDKYLTNVKIKPFRPATFGNPADRYIIEKNYARKNIYNEDRKGHETYVGIRHSVASEVFESLEAAREWCRDHVDGYRDAPRRDAVAERTA